MYFFKFKLLLAVFACVLLGAFPAHATHFNTTEWTVPTLDVVDVELVSLTPPPYRLSSGATDVTVFSLKITTSAGSINLSEVKFELSGAVDGVENFRLFVEDTEQTYNGTLNSNQLVFSGLSAESVDASSVFEIMLDVKTGASPGILLFKLEPDVDVITSVPNNGRGRGPVLALPLNIHAGAAPLGPITMVAGAGTLVERFLSDGDTSVPVLEFDLRASVGNEVLQTVKIGIDDLDNGGYVGDISATALSFSLSGNSYVPVVAPDGRHLLFTVNELIPDEAWTKATLRVNAVATVSRSGSLVFYLDPKVGLSGTSGGGVGDSVAGSLTVQGPQDTGLLDVDITFGGKADGTFKAEMEILGDGSIYAIELTTPGSGSPLSMSRGESDMNDDSREFELDQHFTSFAQLQSSFPNGTYSFSVNGGAKTFQVMVTLSPSLAVPTITMPENGSRNHGRQPDVAWTGSAQDFFGVSFEDEGQNGGGDDVFILVHPSENSTRPAVKLRDDRQYSVKVDNISLLSSIIQTASDADAFKLLLAQWVEASRLFTVGNVKLASISAGYNHSLMTAEAGWYGWGQNYNYSLGGPGNADKPTLFTGYNFRSVSAGSNHSLAIEKNGQVWGFGNNYSGELGNGTQYQTYPTMVNIGNGKAVSAGSNFSLVLTENGDVYSSGSNYNGQLGLGDTNNRASMTMIPFATPIQHIATGSNHSLAIDTSGVLWVWGANGNGQLGSGNTIDSHVPTQVGLESDWVDADGGYGFTVSLKSDGTVWSCGYPLGVGGEAPQGPIVVMTQVQGLINIVSVSAGEYFALALDDQGRIWSWGHNYNGQLGDTSYVQAYTPVMVALGGFVEISAGSRFALGRRSDGTVWGWGQNDRYNDQLGNRSAIARVNRPTMIFPFDENLLAQPVDGGIKRIEMGISKVPGIPDTHTLRIDIETTTPYGAISFTAPSTNVHNLTVDASGTKYSFESDPFNGFKHRFNYPNMGQDEFETIFGDGNYTFTADSQSISLYFRVQRNWDAPEIFDPVQDEINFPTDLEFSWVPDLSKNRDKLVASYKAVDNSESGIQSFPPDSTFWDHDVLGGFKDFRFVLENRETQLIQLLKNQANSDEFLFVAYSGMSAFRDFQTGPGEGQTNVAGANFEVTPTQAKTGTTQTFDVYFKVDFGAASIGFDKVEIDMPFDFGTPSNITLSTSASNGGTYTPVLVEEYSVNVDQFGSKTIQVSLNTRQTQASGTSGFYKISFDAPTSNFDGPNYFNVYLDSSLNPFFFSATPGDAESSVSSNDQVVNVFFGGEFLGPNVSEFVAEVVSVQAQTSSVTEFSVITKALVSDLDQGFNKIGVELPYDFILSSNAITVETFNGSSFVGMSQGVDYTLSTDSGKLNVLFTQSSSAPTSGTAAHIHKISFFARTFSFPGFAFFYAFVDNSVNPNKFYAFPGNAEDPDETDENSINTSADDQLDVVIDPAGGLQTGKSVSELTAEIEYTGTPSVDTNLAMTVVIKVTTSSGDNGFNEFIIDLPPGFTRVGSPTLSTDGGTTLVTSGVTLSTSSTEKVNVTFTQVQGTGTYVVGMTVKTPVFDGFGTFNVSARNHEYFGSEIFAYADDADGDSQFGTLDIFVTAGLGSGSNLGELVYEVTVTTGHGGVDLGATATDTSPFWQVFVKPQFAAGDLGFNLLRLDLYGTYDISNPSNITISSAPSATVEDRSTWGTLRKVTDYTLDESDPFAVKVRLVSLQTPASATGYVYIVSFKKKVTPFPYFMYVSVHTDQIGNALATFGYPGDADGLSGNRNDGGFPVTGSFSTTPNLSSAKAEIITSGTVLTNSNASMNLFISISTESGGNGIDTIELRYPFDLTGMTVSSISMGDTVDAMSTLSSLKYSASNESDTSTIKIDLKFTTGSGVFKVSLSANTPPYPIYNFFELQLNNSSNYNPFHVLDGDVSGTYAGSATLDGFGELAIGVAPDFSLSTLKNILTSLTAETVARPESGTQIATASKPDVSVVFKTVMSSNDVVGFDILKLQTPDGFLMPTLSSAYKIYRSTSASGLALDASRLTSGTHYDVSLQGLPGEAKFTFKSVQNTTNVTAFDGMLYRVEFTPEASPFADFPIFEVVLANKTNPIDMWANWGSVVAGSDIYSGSVIDNDSMYLEIVPTYNPNFQPSLTELSAEVSSVPTRPLVGEFADYSLKVKPTMASGKSFDSFEIRLPYGFGEPQSIIVSSVASAVTGTVSMNSRKQRFSDGKLSLFLSSADSDTSSHYYIITFQAKAPDFPQFVFMEVEAASSTNGDKLFAFPGDADGDSTNTNDLLVDVVSNVNLSNIGGSGGFSFTPLVNELTVEATPGTATISATKQTFTLYVSAKDNSSGQQGFDKLEVQAPFEFENISSITVATSTDFSTFTTVQQGAGLKSAPSSSDFKNITINFSTLQGQASDVLVKVEFKADMPVFPSVGFIDALVDKSTNSLPQLAFPGNATTEASTDDNLVLINPDFSTTNFSLLPLESFFGEVSLTGGVASAGDTNNTATVDMYLHVTKGVSGGGFDLLEINVPFDFGKPSNISLSTALASAATSAEAFSLLSSGVHYELKTDDPYNFRIKLKTDYRFTSSTAHVYKISFQAVTPSFHGLFFFDAKVTDTTNAGVFMTPFFGDAVPFVSTNSLEATIIPNLTNLRLDISPVASMGAEIFPNTVNTSAKGSFTISSRSVLTAQSAGFSSLKVLLPQSFGTPSSIGVEIPAIASGRKLVEGVEFKTNTLTEGVLSISLTTPVTFTNSSGIAYSTVTFVVQAGKFPGPEYFEILASTPNTLEVSANWEDVHATLGDASLAVIVQPDVSNIDRSALVADSVVAEAITTAKNGGLIIVSTDVHVDVYTNVVAASDSATGFNVISVDVPEDFGKPSNFTVKSGVTSSTTLALQRDYTVDQSDSHKFKINFTSIRSTTGVIVGFDVKTPSSPLASALKVEVGNTTLPFPSQAIGGDVNGTIGDSDDLLIDVLPDASLYTTAELAKNNVSSLLAEAMVIGSNAESKDVQTSTSASIRVYVKAVIEGTDRGFNKLRIKSPADLSKPANLFVYSSDAGVVSRVVLVDTVNYMKSISDLNDIVITFADTITSTTTFQVEFSTVMPKFSGYVVMEVFADNTAFSLERPAYWENLNGNGDDNGDGQSDSFGDNDTVLNVLPVDLGAQFQTLVNADGLTAELISDHRGTVGATATIAWALSANIETGNQGINLINLQLPADFSVVTNFQISRSTSGSAASTLVNLVDYTVNTDEPDNITVQLTATQAVSAIYYTTMTVSLPNTTGERLLSAFVDNTITPKMVEGEAGNAVSGGTDSLTYTVRPMAVSDASSVAKPVSTLKGRISPVSVDVYTTTSYTLNVTATMEGTDAGFNVLRIERPESFSTLGSVVVSTAPTGGSFSQLLQISDYKLNWDNEGGLNIELVRTIISSADIKVTFNSRSSLKPGSSLFVVKAFNRSLPSVVEASEDTQQTNGHPGKLRVVVTPSRRNDLSSAPMAPASILLAEVLPTTAATSSSTELSLYLEGQVSTLDNGFNQIIVNAPIEFGALKNITLAYRQASSGTYQLLTPITHYTVDQMDSQLSFNLNSFATGPSLFETNDGFNRRIYRVGFTVNTPAFPRLYDFKVAVDNSSSPLRMPGVTGDVTGDGLALLSLDVRPGSFNASVATVSSVTGELSTTTVARSTQVSVDVYVKAEAATSSVGFNVLEISVPQVFSKPSNIIVSTYASATATTAFLLSESTDYILSQDASNNIRVTLTNVTHAAGGATPVFKVSMSMVTPFFIDTHSFGVNVVNSANAVGVSALPGDAHANTSSSSLNLSVIDPTAVTTTGKRGFFGEGTTPTTKNITNLLGVVRVWDGSSFTSSIVVTTSTTYQTLFFTTPSFSGSDAGFDYLNIDLPDGAGAASQFTVFMRNSSGGNSFLEEFFDYSVDLKQTGKVIVSFQNQNGTSKPINATKMGSNTQLIMAFNLELPKRLGTHFFDMYVDNSANPDRFYVDSEAGNRDTTQAIASRTYTDSSAVVQNSDGTRFMSIAMSAASTAAAVTSVTAEIESVGLTQLPTATVKTFRLDFETSSTGSQSFKEAVLLLPEGFVYSGGLTLGRWENGVETTQTLYTDYTVSNKYPRSLTIHFAAAQTSARYTARFAMRTALVLNGINSQTYRFGLLIDQAQTASTISSTPVYASEGNFAENNGAALRVSVGSDRLISGTISFATALTQTTKVTVKLLNSVTLAEVGVTSPIAVDPVAGATSVAFTISQLTSSQAAGLDDGNYIVRVSAFGFQTKDISTTATPISIVSGSSVTGLSTTLQANDTQAFVAIDNALVTPGAASTISLSFTPTLHNGATSVNSITITPVATNGAVGSFTSISLGSLSIGGTPVSSPSVTSSSNSITINTSGLSLLNGTAVQVGLTLVSASEQSGLFQVNVGLVTNLETTITAGPASSLNTEERILVLVGDKPVAFSDVSTSLTALLSQSYSHQIQVTQVGTLQSLRYSENGLASGSIGVSMNSSGLISGTPTKTSKSGFPFTVTVSYLTSTTTLPGTISQAYLLFVSKLGFELYSVEPMAIPTTGGQVVLRGLGLTSTTKVQVGGVNVSSTFVNQNVIVASVPAMEAGSKSILITDGIGDSADVAKLPNPVNSQSLLVALATSSSHSLTTTIGADTKARIQDYRIIGIPNFYQGITVDILKAAFGTYNTETWRAFGYDVPLENGYYELNSSRAVGHTHLRPGTGFWFISRVSGSLATTGIASDSVDSYTVNLPPRGWSLVANLFSSPLTWANSSHVQVLAGKASEEGKVITGIDSPSNIYVNQTLWEMDNSSSSDILPYKVATFMKSGQGYWVYNKTSSSVTLKLSKPSTSASASKSEVTLYKPDENLPPEAPMAIQALGESSGAGGGGGGCFLSH